MTQEGIRSKATLDEAWRNKHRVQLVIGFRQEEPGDYELYGWIQKTAKVTSVPPGEIVKAALRAGRSTAQEKARDYSQSVRKAKARFDE